MFKSALLGLAVELVSYECKNRIRNVCGRMINPASRQSGSRFRLNQRNVVAIDLPLALVSPMSTLIAAEIALS